MGKDGEGQPGLGAIGTPFSIPSPRFLFRGPMLSFFPPEEKLSFRTLCKVQPNSNRSGTLGGFFSEADGGGGKGRVAQGIVV